MSAEHGSVQSGGLRREHLVAAAMVAAVTVVLGFASGFGVRDLTAAASPPANPAAPVTTQPGGQPAPPLAGAPPAGAARPSGSPVGLRPGVPAAPGAGAQSGFDSSDPGFSPGFDSGGFPIPPPTSGGEPAAPPAGPVGAAPQCPPGLLDQLLALLAEVLGGTAPTQALSNAGAVIAAPAEPATTGGSGAGTMVADAAVDVPVLLPVGDRTILVSGLLPLLDAVAQWELAHREMVQPDGTRPAEPLPPLAAAPAAGDPAAAASGDQLSQLAALLAPVGLYLDPGTGVVDPLLAPVLGSLGCGGIVPAAPPGAVQ